ncbi:MAG: lipoprotein signal peptidase [Betaproteobacteria bacterium]|nr:lipoprotein signal peptidase [Betaproteobacteria bacterium]
MALDRATHPSPLTPLPAGEGKNGLKWLWLSALIIALDQLTKLLVIDSLTLHEAIPLTDFFNLMRAHNTGAAFSLLADQPGWQRLFFVAVALVASGIIFHLLRKTQGRPLFCFSLALILGGALGNVIDRIAYGHVVDFLDFYLGTWHWPAFNVADSGITVGAVLLIADSLRKPS